MDWFLIALITPVFYAISTHIDKQLLLRFGDVHSIPALIMISSVVGVLFAAVLFTLDQSILDLRIIEIVAVLFAGALTVIALFPYFYALEEEEVSIVAPVFQTIPIFSFVLAYIFLGEELSPDQLLGSAIILTGSILLSIDLGADKMAWKSRNLVLLLFSSFLFSASAVIYKAVVIEASLIPVLFWEWIGVSLVGLVMLLRPHYRAELMGILNSKNQLIVVLNACNEILAAGAGVATRVAQSLVPVALVQLVGGFHPGFVFLLSFLLTIFFPKILKEALSRKILLQKLCCTSIIFAGLMFIL